MSASVKPLLSIGIPTYNRAEYLEKFLPTLVEQVRRAGGAVELIVSDNCSEDHTPEVMERLQHLGPVVYFRQPKNIGARNNFFYIASELAKGDYCWLVGDDDYIKPGGVEALVGILRGNTDIEYVYMNYSSFSALDDHDISDLDDIDGAFCRIREVRRVGKWELIADFCDHVGVFTFLSSNVMKTSFWRDFCDSKKEIPVGGHIYGDFASVYTTYPHAVVAASRLVGRPACYVGVPYVVMAVNSQAWAPMQSFLALVRVLDFADIMEGFGAEPRVVRRFRNITMGRQSSSFWKLVLQKTDKIEKIRPIQMLRRYWKYTGFWIMLVKFPLKKIVFSCRALFGLRKGEVL